MKRYILARLLRMLITTWIVVTFVFVVLRVSGDPIQSLIPTELATPELLAYYRELYGFDQPMLVQYFSYIRGIFSGSMGVSFQDGREATQIVADRMPDSLRLMGVSFAMMLVIGIPAGVIAGLNRGKFIDRIIMSISVAGYSLPQYLLGILLIWFFAVYLRVLPSSGSARFEHIILPAFTMALYNGAIIARFTRSGVLEVLGLPHVRAAAAQGWSPYAIAKRDVLPNAAIPLITVVGYISISMMTGAILVEWVFGWPGIGRLLIQAVTNRDLPVVQTLVLFFAIGAVLINFLADVAYAFANPKIRLSND